MENSEYSLVYRDKCGLPVGRSQTVNHWYGIMYFAFSEDDAARFRGIERDRIPLKRAWRRLRLEAIVGGDNFSTTFSITDASEVHEWLSEHYGSEAFARNDFMHHVEGVNHVASPPFISESAICEVMTSAFTPVPLSDEILDRLQWALYVLNKPRVLLLVQNKLNREIEGCWIDRDQNRIDKLSGAANTILKAWDLTLEARGSAGEIAEILGECNHLETSPFGASDPSASLQATAAMSPEKRLDWPIVVHVAREYCLGSSVEEIARNSDVDRLQVVAALARLIYGIDDAITLSSDRPAAELSECALQDIETAYRSSESLEMISSMSDMPLSAILHHVINRFSPPIPGRVIQEVDRDIYVGF